MNDQFTNFPNPDDETIARKLNQVAEQTRASSQFAADLEVVRSELGWDRPSQ